MSSVGFEPTISAGERPKTYALDRTAAGTGIYLTDRNQKYVQGFQHAKGQKKDDIAVSRPCYLFTSCNECIKMYSL
jgi:hypothetical protein